MDYFTNGDIYVNKPLSHAALLKQHMIQIHLEAGGTYEEEEAPPSSRKRKTSKLGPDDGGGGGGCGGPAL